MPQSATMQALLGFRFSGIRHGRHLLCRQPKSEAMALVGSRNLDNAG
jgi:hypothetical protein